jgi:hypothetical protein
MISHYKTALAYIMLCVSRQACLDDFTHHNIDGQIHLIASLTAGLSHYHDEFAVAVVDEVC